MEKEMVYYWDIHDKKLTEKRKKDLKFWYAMIILFLVPVTLLNLPNLVDSSQKTMGSFIVAILIWVVTCIVVTDLLRGLFILPQKAAINNGIKLTSSVLKLGRYEYPLSSVLYSEIVEFMGTGGLPGVFNPDLDKWLCVAIRNKKGKIKFYYLLRYGETTDIQKLSNLIRQVKGLPEQIEIKSYGSQRGYYRWKKEVMEKLNLE